MANAGTDQQLATVRRSRWLLALVTTSLSSTAGLVVAVQQFVLKFLWDQSAHTRTIGGIGIMLLGVVGIGLPVLLVRYRQRFLSMRPSRQWFLVIGIPLAYILAFSLCMEASMRTTTLVLPRPFTPTAVVSLEHRRARVEFRGGWNPHLESAFNGGHMEDGVERFDSRLYQGFLRYPSRETITIMGRAKLSDDGTVQITLDVDAKEPLQFSILNLDNVEIRRDGQPVGESDLQSGKFQMTVTGSTTAE